MRGSAGAAFRLDSVLRFALNAPPSGLRRASLQPESNRTQARTKNQETAKGQKTRQNQESLKSTT